MTRELSADLFLTGMSVKVRPISESDTVILAFTEPVVDARILGVFVRTTEEAEALLSATIELATIFRERDRSNEDRIAAEQAALDAQAAQDQLDEAQALIDATDTIAREAQDASESGDPVVAAAILNTPDDRQHAWQQVTGMIREEARPVGPRRPFWIAALEALDDKGIPGEDFPLDKESK